jgi:hypothetical protein
MAVPFTLNRFTGPVLAILGRSAMLAKISTLQLALTIGMSLAAAPYGLTAIAAAYVIRAYLTLPVQMWAFKRYSGIGYRSMLLSIAPTLAAALLMAAVLIGLDRAVGDQFRNRGVFLLFMLSAGAVVYAVSLLVFARRFVAQQLNDLKRLLPGGSAKFSGAGA